MAMEMERGKARSLGWVALDVLCIPLWAESPSQTTTTGMLIIISICSLISCHRRSVCLISDWDVLSLTVGESGTVTLEDLHLFEKNAHFNRERVPERVVHAKGAGAHGYFEVTQ